MNYIQYQMAQISAKFTEKFSLDFNAVSIVFYIYAVLLYRLMVITDKDWNTNKPIIDRLPAIGSE